MTFPLLSWKRWRYQLLLLANTDILTYCVLADDHYIRDLLCVLKLTHYSDDWRDILTNFVTGDYRDWPSIIVFLLTYSDQYWPTFLLPAVLFTDIDW